MVEEMVNSLLIASVTVDGVLYVPVMVAIETFVPLFVGTGLLVAAFCFLMIQLFPLAERVGEILVDWLCKRFARKPTAE